MKLNKGILIFLGLALLLSSCVHFRYYKKVRKNIGEFEAVLTRIKTDSVKFECIYPSTADTSLRELMQKFRLNRLCITRANHTPSTMISFHRDHDPFFGKADVIYYDFGSSDLRNVLNTGIKRSDEKLRPINSTFIYALYSKPAFGF